MTPPTRESGIDPPDSKEPAARPRVPLRTVAAIFLRLGATSFGGPAAHIALMEDEFVRRRGWLTHDEFLDLLGATNLIPGPNSTEMAIHIGHRVAGWRGLLVAGACFTLPALLIVTALAWVYVRYGQLPAVAAVLYCIKPVVIAVVVQALLRLGRVCIRAPLPAVAAVVAISLAILGVHELVVLFGVGLAVPLLKGLFRKPGRVAPAPLLLLTTPALPVAGGVSGTVSFGLWPLFLVFSEDRRGAVRQRLRPARLPPRRPRRPVRLADRTTTPRCRRRGADDPRSALHHSRVHRLSCSAARPARPWPPWESSCPPSSSLRSASHSCRDCAGPGSPAHSSTA